MKLAISRAYVSRSASTRGPGAYLLLELDPAECEHLSHCIAAVAADLLGPSLTGSAQSPESDPQSWTYSESTSGPAELWRRLTARLWTELKAAEPIEILVAARDAGTAISMALISSEPELARRTGELAVRMIDAGLRACLGGDARANEQLVSQRAELADYAATCRTCPTSDAIALAATRRGLPVIRFDRWPLRSGPGSGRESQLLLQLGWGRFGRRISAASLIEPDAAKGALISDRLMLAQALTEAGIPTPPRDSEFTHVNQRQRAIRAAERIGFPVTIKARMRTGDPQCHRDIHDADGVSIAYDRLSSACSRWVVVERDLPGDSFRLLVIGDRTVAARRVCPAGTGCASSDKDPVDPRLLQSLHPDTGVLAVRAARVLGMTIAEVEIITEDIGQPLAPMSGAVVDVHPVPDLTPYCMPDERSPLEVATTLVDHLFPGQLSGRIPIVTVTGTTGKTTTCRMTAKILEAAGFKVGLACTDGVYVDGKQLHTGLMSGITGALLTLIQPDVDAAVLETSRGDLVARGLGFDHSTAAACINVADDHLGSEGIETLAQMAALKRVVVESATDCAVVNADDPYCLSMLPLPQIPTILLVSRQAESPAVERHLARGGCAIQVRKHDDAPAIVMRRAARQDPIIRIQDLPSAWNGAARHNVENALFAVALASALGIPAETIRAALSEFGRAFEDAPGRLNVYDRLPFTVVLDFAHNAPGFRALCGFVGQTYRSRCRHLVLFWPSNSRRIPELLETARTIAPAFDTFICRDTIGTPESATGTVAREVAAALIQAGVSSAAVQVIPGLSDAVDAVLHQAAPGDLVVITVGLPALDVWRQLEAYRATACPGATT